jgi:hypothetical protein
MLIKELYVKPLDSPVYVVECYVVEKYKRDMTSKEIRAIHDILINTVKKYSGVSFLLADSTTDNKTANKYKEYTGKKGRPKRIVEGVKTLRHTHIRLIGNKSISANKAAERVKERINKRYKDKLSRSYSRGTGQHAVNDLAYCFRQADHVYKSGDFDFSFFDGKGEYIAVEA